MSDGCWRQGFAPPARAGPKLDLQTPWWRRRAVATGAGLSRHDDYPETPVPARRLQSRSTGSLACGAGGDDADAKHAHQDFGLGQRHPLDGEANRGIVLGAIAIFGAERAMLASNFLVDSLCVDFDTPCSGFKTIVSDLPAARLRRLPWL
jgi:hypothetical protein